MIRKIKKAFTLVELVVVIAIIAILSGVSVAVYVAVTNNAKQSVDLQIAARMNKAVDIYEVENTIKSLTDVLYAIEINDGCETKTSVNGTQFMWDTRDNSILYVDSEYNVLNFKGYSPYDHGYWMSLLVNEQSLQDNSSSYTDLF